MKRIVIEEYNPKWKLEFEKAKEFYNKALFSVNHEVVHVGSTSIVGLSAKPILDIDIIVDNEKESGEVIALLSEVGYKHIGNVGVEGREALKYADDNQHITWMKHNLYVCLRGNENLKNHLLLKRHLSNNKEAVKEYGDLKRKLAEKFPDDIDSYIDGKTDLITSFLKAEGMDLKELLRIESINKVD